MLQQLPATDWVATVVTSLARLMRQRGRLLKEEELAALVWTLEFSRPRPGIDDLRSALSEAALQFLSGGDDEADWDPVEEEDEEVPAAALADDQSEEVLAGLEVVLFASMDLAEALGIGEPWSLEPQDCFDPDLFYRLRGVLDAGASLRSLLGRQGGGSLTGARAARLTRTLASRLLLDGDSSVARREKLSQARSRGEEVLLEGVSAKLAQDTVAVPPARSGGPKTEATVQKPAQASASSDTSKRRTAAVEGARKKGRAPRSGRQIIDLDDDTHEVPGVGIAVARQPTVDLGSDLKRGDDHGGLRRGRSMLDLDSEEDGAAGGADVARQTAAESNSKARRAGASAADVAASSSSARPRREIIDLDDEGDGDQPLDSGSEEGPEVAKTEGGDASPSLKRAVLYMHHIAAPAKKRFIRQKAKRFGLTGLYLFGQPGRVFVEGDATAVERYVQEVKSLRWMICSLQGSWPTEGRCFDRFRQLGSDREFREELSNAELSTVLEGLHTARPAAKRHGMDQHAQP